MPQKIYDTISAWSQQNLNSLHVNNKGADQTALLRSQISTFFNLLSGKYFSYASFIQNYNIARLCSQAGCFQSFLVAGFPAASLKKLGEN